MNNRSCIYWFSGTGNSLYAAKRLSAELGDVQLEQITESAPSGTVGGKGTKIGFVFPSYGCNLPRAVRTFVEKLEISPDTYIFTIVTMGGPGQGTVAAMKKALKEKGLHLNYGRGVHMPANYVLLYNPADSSKSSKALDKADQRLSTFAAEISSGLQVVKSHPFIMNKFYKNIEALDAGFKTTDACTSCGLCERICPVKNIQLESGKPEWLRRCEHCVACISWCPARAIEYGSRTQSRRRYRNPRIKADELIPQEK